MPRDAKDTKSEYREACRLTGASWVAVLEKDKGWNIRTAYRLDKKSQAAIKDLLKQPSVNKWIERSARGKKPHSKELTHGIGLHCKRLYIFPGSRAAQITFVGADELDRLEQAHWQVVFERNNSDPLLNSDPLDLSQLAIGIPPQSPEALDQALERVLRPIEGKVGWLAVRAGDHLIIKTSAIDMVDHARRIALQGNPLFRDIFHRHQPVLVGKTDLEWAMIPRIGFSQEFSRWAALPLIIGRRPIGLIGCWLREDPDADAWDQAIRVAAAMAPSVEGSIVFEDLSNHLRRMAVVNDFSGTISSAIDLGQIVQPLFSLLERTFDTNRIIIQTYFVNGTRYVLQDGAVIGERTANSGSKTDTAGIRNEIRRINKISDQKHYKPFYSDSQSAITMPLKFHRQIIGMFLLEGQQEDAFTFLDENLAAVISSHLAGLLENGRLRQEAEARARNLSLIHTVVEQVIGSNNVDQVSQIAAELIAKNFGYELVGIALINNDNDMRLLGIGGSAAEVVKPYLLGHSPDHRRGIVGRVLLTGQSYCINDVTTDPIYTPIPGWEAGSEMCVPLKDGAAIVGIIDVESMVTNAFTPGDMMVLESLAGILTSVFTQTLHYQNLQATVDQLQVTRAELQERISAQRVAESKLVQAAKLAAVGEMAAGIAHELNNPLTTISGFTELALDSLPEDLPIKPDLELVLKESQRARDVVRRLLDFARKSESVRTRWDIKEIVLDVLNLTQHLLKTSGILVHTRLVEGLPWPAVDRSQIKQVLLNIIHNSMHAMPSGGVLSISTGMETRDARSGIYIQIDDSGTGIPPDQIDRIFEPFYTTRSGEGGTGLGLSISYGIIIDHQGQIGVESTVGKGSSFIVWLPTEDKT
jgi:signal transduction histidine kinase